jgi:hypothetical protein
MKKSICIISHALINNDSNMLEMLIDLVTFFYRVHYTLLEKFGGPFCCSLFVFVFMGTMLLPDQHR